MNLQYHIYELEIKCPYCNKDQDDDHVVAKKSDVSVNVKCEYCGMAFNVQTRILFNSYSDCELNGIEHDLEKSSFAETVFNCKNCSQHKIIPPVTER